MLDDRNDDSRVSDRGSTGNAGVATAGRGTALACLALLLKFLDRPVDIGQLRHQYGRGDSELSITEILRCLKDLGIKSRVIYSDRKRLARLPLPVLAVGIDDGYFVNARNAGNKVIICNPILSRPLVLVDNELRSRWTGELILLATRELIAGDRRPFDVT